MEEAAENGAGRSSSTCSKHLPFGQRTSTSVSLSWNGGSTTRPTPSPRPHASNSFGFHVAGFLMTASPALNFMVNRLAVPPDVL